MGMVVFVLGLLIAIDASTRLDGKYKGLRSFVLGILMVVPLYLAYKMGYFDQLGLVKEYVMRESAIQVALIEHMVLTLVAALVGLLLAVLMAYKAYKNTSIKRFVLGLSNGAQVIPTLSFLGLLMIPLTYLTLKFTFLKTLGISGIGFFPAFIVLTSYTLLPIVNQSIAGFETINTSVIQSAQSMGMSPKQVLYRIELPLALPSILSGFKVALIQTTANAILAGLVGGGGLGTLLFLGLAQSAPDLVTLSASYIVVIALILNGGLSLFIHLIEKRRGNL
jgi:osmoprotectant transport system permease protein